MKKRLIAVAAASLLAAIALIGSGPSTTLAADASELAPGTSLRGNDWEFPSTSLRGNDWE
ncbi:MAG: hypothetical protein H0U61_08755 [Nocardioidaceae bacterium]|nr:hypothetical protein [Nocardioidaceae bacterium]